MAGHYLPADALNLLEKLIRGSPFYTILILSALYGTIAGLIRWRFHSDWASIRVLTLFLTATLLFVWACLYILHTEPGYRIRVFG